jgi:deoxyhypusine synthase
MTLKSIKHKIASKLFPEYLAEVERQKNLYQRAREGLSVVDLVREQLAGFDRKQLDDNPDILEEFIEMDAEEAFLSDVHTLAESKALKKIVNFLVRDKLWYVGTVAEDMVKVNFGRATINGIELVLEEIGRLDAIYKERHAGREAFDKHEDL